MAKRTWAPIVGIGLAMVGWLIFFVFRFIEGRFGSLSMVSLVAANLISGISGTVLVSFLRNSGLDK